MRRSSNSRRHYRWQEALFDACGQNHRIQTSNNPKNGCGDLHIAIYGDTFDESQYTVSPLTELASAVDEVYNQRSRHVERIVGDISYRGYHYGSAAPGSDGANPIWMVRFGAIVLESDGELGIPLVKLDDFYSADIEANWLYTEQFTVVGADDYGTVGTGSPSTDGLNHFVVDRHYDIRVGRRLDPHDILVFVWNVDGNSMYFGNEPDFAQQFAVTFRSSLRLLAT